MPARAALVIALFAALGLAAVGMAVASWESQDLIKFAGFLLVAMFFSGMRFRVPGVMGTISPAIIFVLLAVLELSVTETIALGVAAMTVQSYWQETAIPPLPQVAFTVCSMAAASAAAAVVYHAVASGVDPTVGLMLATLVLFIVNTAPVTVALAVAEEVSVLQTWKECYLRLLPYYFGSAAVAALVNFAGRYVGWQTVLLSGPAIYLVFRSYRLHLARIENEKKHVEDVSSLHLRTIEALAMAIEAKDSTTHEHLARVQVYAYELGRELGLKPQEMEALQAASILHDIGKLAVPEHIISKPGKLTPEEFEKMKIHPVVGAEILERVQFPYPVVPIVRAHHEKWDGSGYPAGLRGEDIPLGARILAAVDCLDALATDRQYRRALPLPEAMKVVQQESGKAFDPRVVELLSKRYVELEKLAKAKIPSESGKLSTDVKVERGEAPAAGFEKMAAKEGKPEDFVQQIAAARQEVQALFEISRDLGGSLSVSDTLSMLSVKLRNVVPHNTMVVWLRREEKLLPEFVTGDEHRLYGALQIPLGQGLSGWVIENLKPIVNGNPSVESGYLGDQAKTTALRSAIALPLEGVNGVIGVLALYSSERDHFSKDHLRLLMAVAGKIALAVESAQRFHALESSATTDALTGLSNARSLFVQLDSELARAKRDQQPITVMTFDLDGFKQINARFGHLEGDRALRAIAQQMRSACREYDTLARMGGDEFVLVMAGARLEDLEQRKQLFRGLISGVSRQLFSGELLPVSIGTAQFPDDGTDAEQLLAEADRKLYKEKRQRAQAGVRKPLVTKQAEWTGATLVH
ncbi:MAG: HD domain-containing phosphohydrolase [Bryobacteraceae bacterium]